MKLYLSDEKTQTQYEAGTVRIRTFCEGTIGIEAVYRDGMVILEMSRAEVLLLTAKLANEVAHNLPEGG